MSLRSALAVVCALGLAACPGPQDTPGSDAAESDTDAARADPDAARTNTDAARGGADAGGAEADAAAVEADAAVAGADAAAGSPDAAAATLGAVSVADLWTTLQAVPDGGAKGFLLVNVHVPYEGSIPGTDAHLAYADVDALAAYLGSDLDREVVLYCKSNSMSTNAGAKLAARGYRALRYLDGGMLAWTAAGHSLDP